MPTTDSLQIPSDIPRHMERFDVKRGVVKTVAADGGLSSLAKRYFDDVEKVDAQAFVASHGIMTSIEGRYDDAGALRVDVTNVPPDFDDPDAVRAAMDARKRWTQFLDEATGYNSKQRGDKAKEWAKKATKAKSGVSSARHFMSMSENLAEDVKSQANALIEEIEEALENGENTRAAGRAEKLGKLLSA